MNPKTRLPLLASIALAAALRAEMKPATDAAAREKPRQIILLRHGESEMNTQQRTSGWGDARLTEKGAAAGLAAGGLLKKEGVTLDAIHTSCLSRAIKTAWLALEGMDMTWVPVRPSWRLNETNQGAFEGKTRGEQVAAFGEERVKTWELGFDVAPPLWAADDPLNPADDPRYAAIPGVPQSESMRDTLERVRAYWLEVLVPEIQSGKTLLVVGHSNALRCLSKCMDDTLEESTLKQMEIPNAVPIVHTLDAEMKSVSRRVLDGGSGE